VPCGDQLTLLHAEGLILENLEGVTLHFVIAFEHQIDQNIKVFGTVEPL
jgi:hypothetical protein